MEVKDWEGEILFLHRVIPGASDRSYGIHVAELAGVPRTVLDRAAQLLAQREEQLPRAYAPPRTEKPAPQLSLFRPPEEKVLQRLRELDLDHLRPLDALRLLDELKTRLEPPGASGSGLA
jgi:DNA mismatch repair protein MutS